jgi:hypothetical protein
LVKANPSRRKSTIAIVPSTSETANTWTTSTVVHPFFKWRAGCEEAGARKSEAHAVVANAFLEIIQAFRIPPQPGKAANCRVFNGQPPNVVICRID